MPKPQLDRLADFVNNVSTLLKHSDNENQLLDAAKLLLAKLLIVDDWLPDEYAKASLTKYQQYLLYRDPQSRFSVVSFVWGPGQRTPVHDHTVWGVVGVLRGAELSQTYDVGDGLRQLGPARRLNPGDVEAIAPSIGDVHQVANAFDDQASVSIHLYGADIGTVRRSIYGEDGSATPFISGYADADPLDLSGLLAAQ